MGELRVHQERGDPDPSRSGPTAVGACEMLGLRARYRRRAGRSARRIGTATLLVGPGFATCRWWCRAGTGLRSMTTLVLSALACRVTMSTPPRRRPAARTAVTAHAHNVSEAAGGTLSL